MSDESQIKSGGDDGSGVEKSPAAQDRSVAEELRSLEAVLQRTGRRLRAPVLSEGLLWYGVTVLAILLSGLAVAAWAGGQGYGIARWIIGLGLGSATFGGLVALVMFQINQPTSAAVAARIQRHSTEFRSDLVAALEFGQILVADGDEALRQKGSSPAMARAHLRRTLARVRQACEKQSLAHLVPTRELTPPIVAFSAGLALLAIPLVLNPGWTVGVLTAERAGAPVVGERVVEDTIVGGLDGVFVYPRYSGLQRRMYDLGTGYIETLEGTEVHLRASLMRADWESLTMVVEREDEEVEEVAMRLTEGGRASATLAIEDNGHYWFKGRTEQGRPVEDRQKRRLRVIADEAPQVRVTSHEGRVEVQPDDVVTLDVEIADDFGLDSLRRVMQFRGAEDDDRDVENLDVSALEAQPTSHETSYEIDLGPLNLQPKDGVVITFEARDNNTSTGPGVGESESVLLYVESPQDKHMRNLARQQEVMEQLLSHLADFLEHPVGARKLMDDGTYRQRVERELSRSERSEEYENMQSIHRRREPILEAMDDVAERLEDDPIVVPRNLTVFKGLIRQIERLHDDGETLFSSLEARAQRQELTDYHVQAIADYAARAEEELEKGLLSLEDLLVSQKMEVVEATADEIEELRDRLKGLLEEYRDSEDPEVKAAIEREMQRLRQRMQELMQRMQMQIKEMPQEHVNLEAMENMDMESRSQDLGADMDAIDEMFEAGDIDGAIEALEEMELDLGSLSGEMGESFGQMEPSGISELDKAVDEMMDQVTQLEEREQALEEQTRELQEELIEERREKLQDMIEPFVEEMLQEVAAQRRGLETIEEREISQQDRSRQHAAADAVEELAEMLEEQDLEQSLQRARDASRALRGMRSTMSLSQRYAREDSQQMRDIRQSLGESDGLVERGERIEERIEDFIDEAQQELNSGEEERFDDLAQEQSEINEQAEQLRQQIEAQGEENPMLQEELSPALEEAQQAMEQAEQSLGERKMQPSLDSERRAIESLGQLGDSMQNALQQQRQQDREDGQSSQDDEEVEIPGEGDREARDRIRREMMEGMRDGRAEEYESQIERYFRSLVE